MKQKTVIIIHCWDGYPEYCWYPYVKKELENKGFKVLVPAFPETEAPKLDKRLLRLNKDIKEPNEDIFLIGHSVGCITILRYLESLKTNQKIGGAVLVAGYTDDLGYKELQNFFQTPINFKEIKKHCNKFIFIHSDNDPYVDLKYADILKENLGGEIIVKHNAGHFSGKIDDEKSCTSLPDVVSSVEKLSE